MTEVAYNNTKNASISHKSFELNYVYNSQTSYKQDVNPHSQFKLIEKLANKLKDLITIYSDNSNHSQEL